jgi:tetratricopeptide (TPR) repeat protein
MDGNLRQQIFAPTTCVSHEELRQYLGGRMTKEGQRRVENHLLDCPLCSDAVEGCEEAGNHLSDDLEDFESFSKKLTGQPHTAKLRQLQPASSYLRRAIAVAAVLVVGAVAYFSFNTGGTPNGPALYGRYYTAYESDVPFAMRSIETPNVDPNFVQGIRAYSEGKFKHASMMLDRALLQQPNHEASLFFGGMARLELGQPDMAYERLKQVANGKGVYSRKANWYLVLCDLKMGKLDAAKTRLDGIVDDGDVMAKEAKALQAEF